MATPGPAKPQRIPKAQALADIRATREALAEIASDDTTTRVAEVTADLTALAGDPAVAASVKRETFYTTGMELIEAEPVRSAILHGTSDELKKHVQAKIDHLKEVSRKRTAAETKIAPLIATLRKVQAAIDTLVGYAALATPPLAHEGGPRIQRQLRNLSIERLTAFLPLAETITVLSKRADHTAGRPRRRSENLRSGRRPP